MLKLTLIALSVITPSLKAHSIPLKKEALRVCVNKKKSQECQYTDHHKNLYIGTCQLISEEQLICVRTRPLQKSELN